MRLSLFLIILMVLASGALLAEESRYVPETDPAVLERLEEWQDLKFGLLMHWGSYSQWGIVESWSLCPEDYGWCERREGSAPQDYFSYKQEYENLQTTFDPRDFDPERWAAAAAEGGMKYVVFTTKHHDGFCMFDTQQTDYKITSEKCPFHTHPRADVTGAIFAAFRAQDMWTGAYFSKPDWNNENYWHPYWPPLDRNVNYDPDLYPDRWEEFVQFTHNQILELMANYGRVDILWLDGGWVAKKDPADIKNWYQGTIDQAPSGFIKKRIVNQDIRMDELVARARQHQPGLIVVDRAVPGIHQNYLTPENRVPEEALPYPWESCIIAGGGWSWVPDPVYKTPREIIHLLVDIAAKGGNLLLNIAPGPDGTWPEGAYTMLEGTGRWLDVNGEAIYGTRAMAPYKTGQVCLTRKEKQDTVFAIYLPEPDEALPPDVIVVQGIEPDPQAEITMLGSDLPLEWGWGEDALRVEIPSSLAERPPCREAWTLKIQNPD